MQRILTVLAVASVLAGPLAGGAATDSVSTGEIRLELDVFRRRESHAIRVKLTGEGVHAEYEIKGPEGKKGAAGEFGPAVREELLRAWGAPSFGLKDWPSEICVSRDVRWVIESGRERRVICDSQGHLSRLNGFREAVRLLLRKD